MEDTKLLPHDELTKEILNFLSKFYINDGDFIYHDTIKVHITFQSYWMEIDLRHIKCFDKPLYEQFLNYPKEFLSASEEAVRRAWQNQSYPPIESLESLPYIQVLFKPDGLILQDISKLKIEGHISRPVRVRGTIMSRSQIDHGIRKASLKCKSCNGYKRPVIGRGLDGFMLDKKCESDEESKDSKDCGNYPYKLMLEESEMIPTQLLRLEELNDNIPKDRETNRLKLYCEGRLCNQLTPGDTVDLIGIHTIINFGNSRSKTSKGVEGNYTVGLRSPYIIVLGFEHLNLNTKSEFTEEEKLQFHEFAKNENLYEIISSLIGPSIHGLDDIKKAIAVQLFSGSAKQFDDGTRRRGDIHILLIGDPGIGKSQLLKYVQSVAPKCVYTSGKGASAVGLTGAAILDKRTKNFTIEGGAMTRADNGIICIDEFDKMQDCDRGAIHEAMEQQTISIAKAGLYATLKARCAVLAAANSKTGRWVLKKTYEQNVDLTPALLSRFDMIFVLIDKQNEGCDTDTSKFVIDQHIQESLNTENSEIYGINLTRYIQYCRENFNPRLSDEVAAKLCELYVNLRNPLETSTKDKPIITVRQLEGLIRIIEAIAKMHQRSETSVGDYNEAVRLFRASTINGINIDENNNQKNNNNLNTDNSKKRRLSTR